MKRQFVTIQTNKKNIAHEYCNNDVLFHNQFHVLKRSVFLDDSFE